MEGDMTEEGIVLDCKNAFGCDNYATGEDGLCDSCRGWQNKWISVKDKLPECKPQDKAWQLVCNAKNGNIEVASYWLGAWIYTNGQRAYGITHWMPLPDTPKD
jgi:hypothetical protein